MRARRGAGVVAAVLAVALLAAGCTKRSASSTGIADPPRTIDPTPDYTRSCSPSGPDASLECDQVVLAAIDNARAKEHVGPMRLPASYDKLTVPQQLLVVINAERVDRHLPPIAGLSDALGSVAAAGASAGKLPANPGSAYRGADTEWIGAVANPLDADYQWMYQTSSSGSSGWADRHILLDGFGAGMLEMGAAFDPTADTDPTDRGGTSLAAVLAIAPSPDPLTYTWAQAGDALAAGTLRPRSGLPSNASATHIPDPPKTIPANPEYAHVCASTALDSGAPCLSAVLAAVNNARAAEGVKPMVLPVGFGGLSVPQQMLVAVNLERVDRGLSPFTGLVDALNANAQKGADAANDPPDPGSGYDVVDTEWAGGSSNGLDAVYGWMYDDGIGSGNLDCPSTGGSGCWGHRNGILDNFGSVGTLVMGAALNPTADTGDDKGGPSMAATLAITSSPVSGYTARWPFPNPS